MRPKVKTARRKASKLHGATAGYVSIVDRGANETPFTLIKSKNGATAMPVKKRGKSKAAKSHKNIATGRKQDKAFRTETMMAKMVFSADLFEGEQDVLDWIKDAEWEAEKIDVTKNADGDWEARPNGLVDADFERISPVETPDEGVSAFVGQRKVYEEDEEEADDEADDEADTETKSEGNDPEDEDEDDEEEDDDEEDDGLEDLDKKKGDEEKGDKKKPYSKRAEFLAKRKEVRSTERKFDAWDAYFSKGNTLAKTLQDGMSYDATPPGYYEVQAAFNAAVSNIISGEGMPADTKQEALNKAAMEYAEIIGGLDTFFDKYTQLDEEELSKHVKDADKRDKLAKWAEVFADWLNGAEPEKAATEEQTTEKKTAEAVTIDYSKVADLVAKAVEPLAKEVETVAGTVEALASRRPTKKAVASDDTGTAAPVTAKKSEAVETAEYLQKKQIKGILG